MRDLAGRVAVVTGAASGIGKAMAVSFARRGMRVVLADVDVGALNAVASRLRNEGREVSTKQTDVSDSAALEALRDHVVGTFGTVHVLCNNAGVDSGAPFTEIPVSTWEWVLGVDLWAVIHGCRLFLPLMIGQGEGHIVNTSSIAAYTAMPLSSAPYVAAKAAVVGISKNLRAELAASATGVGVSLLVPGPVRTNMPTSERARPPWVREPPASGLRDSVQEFIKGMLPNEGMDPADVGELVVRAVIEDRFFALTHPEQVSGPLREDLALMARENPG